jgi:putative ABC transport system permease protein
VRTRVNPKGIAADLRKAIWSLDRDESIGALRTVEEVVDLGLTQPRFRSYVLGGFAGMALILSAVGLYGLLNFLVSKRNREIGVRMALGASRRNIVGLVLGKAAGLTTAGLGLGLLVAIGLTRLLTSLVYGIDSGDPLTFVAATAILLLVGLVASYLPTRRATRLNPVDAIRSE